MTAAEVEQLLRDGRLRATEPDRETALVELESAHIASAEKIVAAWRSWTRSPRRRRRSS